MYGRLLALMDTPQAGWFTADNAPNNDTALKEFGQVVDPEKTRWDPIGRRVRYDILLTRPAVVILTTASHSCIEHAVHISASKVVESVSPAPSAAIVKRIRGTIKRALDGNANADLDQVDADLATLQRKPGSNDEDESDNDEDFGSGDAVGKALALVKQVSDVAMLSR